MCFQCKTPIADEDYLTISDPTLLPSVPTRTYHALHFFCASCGDPFVDPKSLARGREGTLADPYMVHDGYAYCQRCDVRLWKPKCKGCKKGIGGDWVEAVGGVWHPECFSCVVSYFPFVLSPLRFSFADWGVGELRRAFADAWFMLSLRRTARGRSRGSTCSGTTGRRARRPTVSSVMRFGRRATRKCPGGHRGKRDDGDCSRKQAVIQ